MTTNPNPSQEHQFWLNHVTQWRASGGTQAAYCKQHELLPHRLSYYKRKFDKPQKPTQSPGFVSVAVQPAVSTDNPLTLHLANGLRLSGIGANNIAVVKQLAAVLA